MSCKDLILTHTHTRGFINIIYRAEHRKNTLTYPAVVPAPGTLAHPPRRPLRRRSCPGSGRGLRHTEAVHGEYVDKARKLDARHCGTVPGRPVL